jgi:peptidoglycan/LPS O-acetylase OafA/YrhL
MMVDHRHRIQYIDGLRAVAVLTVVASHSVLPGLFGQSFGVMLFFVISGFCLSYPTLAKLHESKVAGFDVYRYAAHRMVRIIPPYYIAIALLFACALFLPDLTHVSLLDATRQILFLDDRTVLLTPPFWSLPVEFRWYFLFPVALWLWTRSPKAFLAAALLIIIAGQATRATSIDLVVLPAFLSGIVAAHVRIHEYRIARFALPACAVMVVTAYLKTGTEVNPAWEAAVFLLVVAAGSLPWLGRLLSMRWLASIGFVSYSIYLVHAPVIKVAEDHGITPIIAGAIGIAFGYAFWLIAERPFVGGRTRSRLISEFETVFAKWFPRLGVGRLMHLSADGPWAPPSRPPTLDLAIQSGTEEPLHHEATETH